MGYLKDTLKGVSWMGALRGLTRVIAFLKIIILARILVPSEFGLFGIATLILAFLEIITETGVNVFLIQENYDTDSYINTAWIVSIIRGFLIALLLVLSAPVISWFFKSPASLNIVLLISIAPFIKGFINPSEIKFQKELHFSKEFFYRFLIYSVDAFVAIFFAIRTHSAYSLVYGLIAGAVFEVIASHLVTKPTPKLEFVKEKLKLVINRGKWVTFAGFFNYLFENLDDATVGRVMDATALGVYQMAYKITSLPMTEVSDVVQIVTFPVYSKISDDAGRLKRAFTKSILASTALVLPFGVAFLLFPDFLVKLILGDKWLSAVAVIKIMSFFGVIRAVTESTYPLFNSLKRQKYVSAITLVSVLGLIIPIVPLVRMYGIVGAGIAGLIGSLVSIPVTVFCLTKVFKK